jgi:1-acyl-sn-glycerol-3-phosphate acyltransferase
MKERQAPPAVKTRFKISYLFNTVLTWFVLGIILLLIVFLTPFYMVISLFEKEKRHYLFTIRILVRLYFLLNFVPLSKRVEYNGIKAPAPGQKRIYVINHGSLIDGLLLFLMPGAIKFFASSFYARIPIFGMGVTAAENVAVSRDNMGDPLNIYYAAKDLLHRGYPLVIFPEGHRSRDSRVHKFQNSAFMLALEEKADIVPVVFETWNILRPGSILIREKKFHVRFLDEIPYSSIKHLKYKQVSDLVRLRILENLLEIVEKHKDANPRYYRHEDHYRQIDDVMKDEVLELKNKVENFTDSKTKIRSHA